MDTFDPKKTSQSLNESVTSMSRRSSKKQISLDDEKDDLRTINIYIKGNRTSIRLEPELINYLKEIAGELKETIHDFCNRVEDNKKNSSRTSAIRVAIARYYRNKVTKISTNQMSAD